MSTTPPIPKPKCPECDTELVLVNNDLPEKCSKCGFVIDGFDAFSRWFKLAMKKAKEGEPPPPPPAPPEPAKPAKRRGILSNLSRRK